MAAFYFQGSYSFYLGDPLSPKFSSIRELLLYYVRNQIPISTQLRIFLRRPICKADGLPHANINHSNVEHDKQPFSRGVHSDMYMAVLIDSGRYVTIKSFHKGYQRARCLEEANILKQCSHHNIIEFFGVSVNLDPMYIITESMFDGVLVHYLQGKVHDMSQSQLTSLCYQAARGMDHLSSKCIVHRDLQAASCMVDEFGSTLTLKITDFGLAKKTPTGKFVSDENESQNAAVLWTAPEVRNIV